MSHKTTGQRLWDYMKKNPISAKDLGTKIGIQGATVLRVLRGYSEPTTATRCKIENFLDKVEEEGKK